MVTSVLELRFHVGASFWDQGTIIGLDAIDNDNGHFLLIDATDMDGI